MSLACWTALAAALAASAGGCSLVYDADDLRRDGGVSADADPDALFVARVTPDSLFEGEGSSYDPELEEMVRAIPIVLVGQNMTAETDFTIEGLGLDGTIEDVVVSGDGHFAAFALRVPILDALGDGETGMKFTIRLSKGDEENTAPLVVVTGLDKLEQEGGALDTDELRGRYTHVVLSGDVRATGQTPLRIVATAGIQISGSLRADAGNAPAPGAGGCAGGGPATAADCGDGSGKAGSSDATPGGGGGGGFGTVGTAGTGGGGQAGGTSGQVFLVPLPPDPIAARGAGGGGGGGALGGQGGGSGGVIELTTSAILSMGASAILSASGADGEDLLCTTGGGGGGGSGGALLIRAGTLLAGADARVEARGGVGAGGGACVGGDGGKGRVRIDRGNEEIVDGDPAPFIGPAPVIDELPLIATESPLSVEVRGDGTESYEIFRGGEREATVDTDADGLGAAEVTLEPGLNRLCVQVAPAADLDYPESQNCVNVAYIKP